MEQLKQEMLEQIQVQADKYEQQIKEQSEKHDQQIKEIKSKLNKYMTKVHLTTCKVSMIIYKVSLMI